ncbi:hypothetical protein ACFSUM_18600 [Virgibacillus siamensis]|uniref:hypothetical protein n=2 Tax=Bacillati TaxID=1783272 RepID=UPI00363BE07A
MTRLSSIPAYDDILPIIAKFKKAEEIEHLKSLQNGLVYMNRLGIYKKIEELEGKQGVGDRYDGHVVVREIRNIHLRNIETDQIIEMGSAGGFTFAFDDVLAMPVFCSYGIDSSKLEIIDEDENRFTVELRFDSDEIERIIRDFGEYALLINFSEFKNQLSRVIKEDNHSLIGKMVKYADYSVNQYERLADKDTINTAFWKSDVFSHQNEYRLVIPSLNIDNPITINIGDLKENSQIYSVSDLVKNPLSFSLPKLPS